MLAHDGNKRYEKSKFQNFFKLAKSFHTIIHCNTEEESVFYFGDERDFFQFCPLFNRIGKRTNTFKNVIKKAKKLDRNLTDNDTSFGAVLAGYLYRCNICLHIYF